MAMVMSSCLTDFFFVHTNGKLQIHKSKYRSSQNWMQAGNRVWQGNTVLTALHHKP
jgi:hypothetical protein